MLEQLHPYLSSQSRANSSDGDSIRCRAKEQMVISTIMGSVSDVVEFELEPSVDGGNEESGNGGNDPSAMSLKDKEEQLYRIVRA